MKAHSAIRGAGRDAGRRPSPPPSHGLRPLLITLAAGVTTFSVLLAVLALVNRSPDLPAADDADRTLATGSTEDQIRALQRSVRANPADAGLYASLGDAFLQRVRETADVSYYRRAERAFAAALRRDPRDLDATIGEGTLALARHDFRGGLRYGLRAQRLAPELVRPLPVIVDAQIELGRYQEAERTLQRLVDEKPSLAAYARVSYFRQLHGDLDGAAEAMRLAVSAGGGAPENVAYVQALLGDLELDRGNPAAAARAYRAALASMPGHAPATVGLARVDIHGGRLARAARRLRGVVERLPLPGYAILLGETEVRLGRRADARHDFELVRAEQRLLRAAGTHLDAELAIFDADHGDPRRAVAIAREVWRDAPSVRSADALGWALTRSGRPAAGLAWGRRALALGSRDPVFLYHAGISARGAGRLELARRLLGRSLAINPAFSPIHAPRARRVLRSLR